MGGKGGLEEAAYNSLVTRFGRKDGRRLLAGAIASAIACAIACVCASASAIASLLATTTLSNLNFCHIPSLSHFSSKQLKPILNIIQLIYFT